ncbi:DUF7574 domain-containing protein [Leifsonia aquatica]|uniref:DUF7574 domain-containing protein n=1 Tax=Leifsonia aquatica TaxID=144185 RepID=UPI000468E0B9|nr:hypothetical protein [Leifsonia aquatica]
MSAIDRYDYEAGTYVARSGFEDWQEVFHEETGGYEWSGIAGWYSPSRDRYFWLEDSGCSCNGFGDSASSIEDFSNGSRADMLRAAEGYLRVDGRYADFTVEERARALAAIRDYQEAIVIFEATRIPDTEATPAAAPKELTA